MASGLGALFRGEAITLPSVLGLGCVVLGLAGALVGSSETRA